MIRSLKDRIGNRFNVSVAETALQDIPARAELSIALVTNEARFAEGVIDKVDTLIDNDARALILSLDRSIC